MSLTVLTRSTDAVLTTTTYVKTLLGTSTSTGNDAAISAYITAASRWAETYVGYPLTAQTYRESLAGYDRRRLMLSRYPVRAVPIFLNGTDTGESGEILSSEFRVEADAGFLNRDEGFEWSVPFNADLTLTPRPGQEFKPWQADYVAGYTYAGMDTGSDNWSTVHGTTSTGRTLPEDIEHAVALKVISLIQGKDSAGGDVTKEELGDLAVWYSASSGGTERETMRAEELLLESYRRMV